MPLRITHFLIVAFFATGCGAIKESSKYQLGNGQYFFKQTGSRYGKVYVVGSEDSIRIHDMTNNEQVIPAKGQTQYFLTRSFDVDVMTVAFKYRPSAMSLPTQLNTDFNGNVFVGYRFDRFKVRYKESPIGIERKSSHRGLTIGGFGGIGSTAMTPWTTGNRMSDEYNGLVFSRGLAGMIAINTLTFGVGVGWDYLTDRDKSIWIYQNKPWYGLTIGLNLN
jgi:hypothetical protein